MAIDSERVEINGLYEGIARFSIVNYYYETLYDRFIIPPGKVTDYRTKFSGVTEEILKTALPFDIAKTEIIEILEGKIIIGHTIDSDLGPLGYEPPNELLRDISTYPQYRGPHVYPTSLKTLMRIQFREQVQKGEHSSVEDAISAMKLYKNCLYKFEKFLLGMKPKMTKGFKKDLFEEKIVAQYLKNPALPKSKITDKKVPAQNKEKRIECKKDNFLLSDQINEIMIKELERLNLKTKK